MKFQDTATISRRGLLMGALGAGVISLAGGLASPAIAKAAGDVRHINLVNPHTGDRINSVYWVEGIYIPEVLEEVDHLMRDWRMDQKRRIDVDVIDIIAAAHRLLETNEPFALFSGYRSPQTNAMLRRKSRGVARNSYHIRGMAADLHLESRSVRQISAAAQRINGGGVGQYSRSDFVHMDCGPVRLWGR